MSETSVQDPPAQLLPGLGSLISNFAIAISLVPLGLFVFSLLGRYFYFAELVGNFRCQIMLLLIPFALLALGIRRWWLSGLILAALFWSMIGIVWVYLPGYQASPGPEKLKIMSYNVFGGNSQHAKVVSQIRDADPDVIAILEYTTPWHRALECLTETYPHQVRLPRWHGFGVAVFSKHPLSDTEVVQLTEGKTDNPFVITNVQFGSQKIRVAALHVFSPTSPTRMTLRNQQLAEVSQALGTDQIPTVVTGDFNCTPWSPFLDDFLNETGLRDSRQGFGYQATWHADTWPLRIPIDHAFVSDEIHVHRRYVGGYGGSDHFPIVYEVSFAD
jgi:endonuclease/exonuclease/phosphatase (EEP) superfamily protein YafD